jgi:sialic acid synthase SpsE
MQIIAEVGSNHCGTIDLATAHIRAARSCGATAVKFQLFRVARLDSRRAVQDQLRWLEMPLEWLPQLRTCADRESVQLVVTPFDPDSARVLRGLVDAVKVSAYDLPYTALLRAVADLDVPVILSTAMATAGDIDAAVAAVGPRPQDKPLTLLQGVAQYPAQAADQNLSVIRRHGYRHWGLSDHTHGYETAIIATALGAEIVEKHFRLDPRDHPELKDSPDFGVSSGPLDFEAMVRAIHRTEAALGTGDKTGPMTCEMDLYRTCRRTDDKTLRGDNT